MQKLKSFWPHAAALIGFIVVALIYFHPVLEGKTIYQSDIVQYTGMAKEQNDFRNKTGEEPYWTNSAFGGMPTYQLGAKYPHNYIKQLDSLLRFLPRPADYLFLYFLGFYVLLMVLKIDPLKAFFGALAFGLSTYLIIILGVGHNAKAHAIAYFPMVLAGVLLVFKKRYILGGILTMLATALEIQANHFQMTYYLLLLLVVVGIYFSIQFIKEKQFKELAKIIGVFSISAILAIGVNATNLMATSEYAKFSTRSNSELTFNPDGTPKINNNAMSYDYITEYSYGVAESLNLIAPRLFGGSNHESLSENSNMYQFLLKQGLQPHEAKEVSQQMPTYWGSQPIVAAPAYIGIVVFFFFVVALFIPNRKKLKTALTIGAALALLLSWGKNFSILTDLFIDYIPLYNKFRAVSSIQVVLELCVPALATLGFYQFFKVDKTLQWKILVKTASVVGGILVFLFLIKGFFDFSGGNDAYYSQAYGMEFMQALRDDRAAMYTSDVLRSMGFALVVWVLLYLVNKEKLKQLTAVLLIGILMVADLFFIDKNYVNKDSFVAKNQMEQPFQLTQVDKEILKDTTHFRVYDESEGLNGARTSYFHKSLGGYHAAKPRRIQELASYQLANKNLSVFSMLNVKYILVDDEKEGRVAMLNPTANGNAWFVNAIKEVSTANEEMKLLDELPTKDVAVINTSKVKLSKTEFKRDSLATIQLETYKPNYLKYKTNNTNDGFAVFSENYYENGWKATIDGKQTPIYNVDYVLRGIYIPAGNHTVEFTFKPEVVQKGSIIALLSSVIMILLIAIGLYFEKRSKAKII
ncbi:YfhO family protein [Flavobacterium sp.]|uniref:YfhO family protein n=1 Tax=Flavobacterium sp. TaxID=239 RepID=UPI00352811AD